MLDVRDLTVAELVEAGRGLRDMLRERVGHGRGGASAPVPRRGAPVAGSGQSLRISNPEVRTLVADCEAAGATVEPTASSHLRVSVANKSVNIAGTPSSSRTVRNDRARVRRILGLDV